MSNKARWSAVSVRGFRASSLARLLATLLACFILTTTCAQSRWSSVNASTGETQALTQEQNRAAAAKLVAEAERLESEKTGEAQKKALEKFREALALWRAAADVKGEAMTLKSMAEIYQATSDTKEALETSERALQLFQSLGDRAGEAEALIRIGIINYDIEDSSKALDYLNRAMEILRQVPDRKLEASALESLGNVHDALGEPRRAMEFLTRSLALRRALGDKPGEASVLSNIGSVHQNLRELRAALENYMPALEFFRAAKDLQNEAITLNNIAVAWSDLGEIPRALEYYSQALSVRRAAGDRRGEGITLANIGSNYYRLGDNEQALAHYNEALELFKKLQDTVGEARVLERIAILHNNAGDGQKALETYNYLLELWRARKDRRSEGTVLFRIGSAHHAMKNYARAMDYLRQSLAIARAVEDSSDEAEVLQRMAVVYRSTGKLEESADAYKQALEIYGRSSKDREPMALYGSARTEILRGNLETARKQIELAIELAESLRGKFSSPALRMSILADRKRHYETYIDVLMRLHEREPNREYDALALQIQELARARGLLDLLNESQADIRQGGDPVLLARERAIQSQINDKEFYRMTVLRSSGKEKQLADVEQELNTLLLRHRETQAEIRAKSPQYAALTQPKPLNLREIQTTVLDPDTVLLEYALGDERSYLWVVSDNSRATFVLPGREEIERGARRFYDQLSASPETPIAAAANRANVRPLPPQADDRETAITLGKMLIGPAADRLGKKRLLVVTDGALEYVPFGALHSPLAPGEASANNARSTDAYRPLIIDHEIVSLPSASVLSFLRNEARGRKRATKAVAVLADPVFRRDDPRLTSSKDVSRKAADPSGPDKSQAVAVTRSARDSGLGEFARLRFTRQEAQSILSLVPAQSRLEALDFAASRATAQSPELGDYRILHFATHGLLNSKHPELSGLVLSLVDDQGKQVDGFLRFHEIYNLKLNADLAVLSACQTALGKEVRGEGLMGLTRGFMYAGAQRVAASLWMVEDRATAELMKRFYEGMLKRGLPAAAALRAAQVSMLKEKRWAAPHYWAAFTLQGEWR
jgi:CHAT domain-containing protein/tetratricopeptide (TPR) repeat protein